MALKRNFSVGLFGSIWSALLGLAVVPLYIKYLGTEAYGLIGFFATTQALLQLLDLGLSPTINREVARCSATNKMQEARSLLHTLSIVYWGMAFVIGLVILVLAPLIATHWLQARALPIATITQALMLMGLVVACRWPVGLYMGALMGMQRVALSSIINTAFGTLSSLGTVAILILVSPTIKAFFIWQAFVGVCYAVVMHIVAWHIVQGKHEKRHFSLDDLKRVWRFSAGLSSIAITGAILIQLDKVILSKILNLESFGHYVLAGTVASSLYIFLTPLFNSICPRLSALVASKNTLELLDLYKLTTRLFFTFFFPFVFMVASSSYEIILIWTGSIELAEKSAPITSLLMLGTAMNGIMHFPYALLIAYGDTKIAFGTNLILITIMIPLTIFLATNYSTVGGAYSWFILNIFYVFIGTWRVHQKYLRGAGMDWLFRDALQPFLASVIFFGIGSMFLDEITESNFLKITLNILMALSTTTLLILTTPKVKNKLFVTYKKSHNQEK